jgi:hypothetical protein
MFLGEFPPLPEDVIQELRQRTSQARLWVSDQVWDIVASKAVDFFEGWHHE